MSSELKKRMLLVKWRGQIETCRAMQSKFDALGKQVETLQEELSDAKDQIESLESEADEYADDLESTLLDVKYWLHDGIVHHKLVSDPRKILRQVEEVLG